MKIELLSEINWNGHLALVFDLDVGQLLSGSTRSLVELKACATSYALPLFNLQKVRLNFRIGCDFSTANHSPLHLFGQKEPSEHESVFDFTPV